MSVGNDKTRILITIPREIKPQLEAAAKRDKRSVSNYVSALIQKDLERQHEEFFVDFSKRIESTLEVSKEE